MTAMAARPTGENEVETARAPVDDHVVPWTSYRGLLLERRADHTTYLVEDPSRAGSRTWTGAAWAADVRSVAARLRASGVRPGDDLAMVATNRPETLLVAFAAWWLGACFVPLDPRDGRERHAALLAACEDPWLVADDADGPDAPGRPLSAAEVLRPAEVPDDGSPEPGLDTPALRLHTSGTSGTPKPILLSMRGLFVNCDAMRTALGWTPGTRLINVLPISHANGLVICSFLPWFAGGSTVLMDRFRSDRFWPAVARSGANACSLVPTVLEYLLADPSTPEPGHGLSHVISGSGPLRPESAQQFEQRFGIPVRQLYGLSETTSVLTMTTPQPVGALTGRMRGSIGTPVPHAEVRVVDPEGRECADEERGEIVARGAMLMLGYAGNPKATAAAYAQGWFHTGDRGYRVTGPGGRPWFFLEGRLGDSISRGGSTVLPQVVDDVLAAHPSVTRAATFGFANRWYGEEVAAFVIAHAPVTEDELRAWCVERVGFDASPKVVIFGEELPTTSVGKIQRSSLANRMAPELAPLWDRRFRRRDRTKPGSHLTHETPGGKT
ncbi:long-chain fatty acid--CoA ligase [Nonomuraea mesophila]|uniref:Long-chain fatty acid--CoA ligase n=2 Tax=Nonomuraea mesophila TaxID=2530382 RepID=A0A4R5FKN1_9ACTN|nr:long-chain fatty acid--CoA ligase [Nonomuraea mesophila]